MLYDREMLATPSPDLERVEDSPSPAPIAQDYSKLMLSVDNSDLVSAIDDLKSVVGDVSSSIINRFVAYYNTHYTGGLSSPDYVIWRSGQYDYHMAVITNGSFSNGTVSGEFDLISYYSNSYYDTMPLVNVQTLSNRNLDIPSPSANGSGYVYSSIDGYLPAANIDTHSSLSVVLSFSMVIILLVALIYLWIRGIFKRA